VTDIWGSGGGNGDEGEKLFRIGKIFYGKRFHVSLGYLTGFYQKWKSFFCETIGLYWGTVGGK